MSRWQHLVVPPYKFWWGTDRGAASGQNSVVLQLAVFKIVWIAWQCAKFPHTLKLV